MWGIRFAAPEHGFVFGDGLWETTDGGQHWTSVAYPGGSILSLAAIDGQVLALTAACSAQGGCAESGTLLRRPLAGGAWSQVTQVRTAGGTDPTDTVSYTHLDVYKRQVLVRGAAHHLDTEAERAPIIGAGLEPWIEGVPAHFIRVSPTSMWGNRVLRA